MTSYSQAPGPIGVFDSGYGGLTILHGIRQLLPEYDYLYLGDNARAPYGSRSFDVVYQFTHQAVMKLFESGCQLVIWVVIRRPQRLSVVYSRMIYRGLIQTEEYWESFVLQLKS